MSTNHKNNTNENNTNKTQKSEQAKKYSQRANEYREQGKIADAIAEYTKAIELEPENPEYYFERGLRYIEAKELEKGFKDFSSVRKIDPKSEYSKILDDVYQSMQIESVKRLTKEIEQNPSNASLYKERGDSYTDLKKHEEAIADYERALELKISDNDIYFDLGNCYYEKGDFEQAYKNFEKDFELGGYFEIDDDLAMKLERISDYFVQHQKHEKAIKALRYILDYNHIYFLMYDIHETMMQIQFDKDQRLIEKELANKAIKYEREKQEIINESQKKLERMMQQYTHTLSNTLFPNTIYEVANKLKNHIEFQKDARILADAYHAEVIIKRQGQLLQARNSSKKDFQYLIRGDRLDIDTQEKAIDVETILSNAAERVIARFLNEDYHKLDSIRDKIFNRRQITIDQLRNSFEEHVFFNENQSSLEWTNSHFISIHFSMTDTWKNIRVRKDNYSEALLQGYFSELLFNALKYGDHEQDQWVLITFTEQKIKRTNYLISEWQNPTTKNDIGTGNGLDGIKNDLEMLNETELEEKSLATKFENAIFEVRLVFKRDLFVPNPKLDYDLTKLLKK
ncbi:MAG: tetratricopeptide repeat protein [Candidatus Lokiarchaeota archaeon]|nr:tetratricopeptide repeat protein [Candidatus Lokiarchaeota archaeon]